MQKKHQPGCECCGCQYFFDDFDRDNDTDVGGNYTETAGDWSITSTALLIQSSNAQLDIDVAHPNSVANGIAGFAFYAFHAGDQVRFVFDYSDANNYKYVQLTVGNAGTLAIVERSAGVDTTLRSVTVNAPAAAFGTIYVYWGDSCDDATPYVVAYMPDDAFNTDEAFVRVAHTGCRTLSFSSDAKALGTGAITSAVYFDQLVLWKHHSSSDDTCSCWPIPCTESLGMLPNEPSLASQPDVVITWNDCAQDVIDTYPSGLHCSPPLPFQTAAAITCAAGGWGPNYNGGPGVPNNTPFFPELAGEGCTYWYWYLSVSCDGMALTYQVQLVLVCFEESGWRLGVSYNYSTGRPVGYNMNANGVAEFSIDSITVNESGEFVGEASAPIYRGGTDNLLCTLDVEFGA